MIVVFLGPSLDRATARATLAAEYRPPVVNGDVIRAVRSGARAIGIIDGGFEWTLSVWHKEILWALTEGTHVFGGASMGALRAAELAAFGMRGIGRIFAMYRDGMLQDDDEVAVAHEAGAGYRAVSDALVNIRLTLAEAERAQIIGERSRRVLEDAAKRAFYPDRRYAPLLTAGRRAGLPDRQLDALRDWLPANRVDQKRADALELLRALATDCAPGCPAHEAGFRINRSEYLERLLART